MNKWTEGAFPYTSQLGTKVEARGRVYRNFGIYIDELLLDEKLVFLVHLKSGKSVGIFSEFDDACVAADIAEDLGDWSGSEAPVPDNHITNGWLYGGLNIVRLGGRCREYVWGLTVAARERLLGAA